MSYLLDTDMLIYLSKRRPPAVAERIDALPPEARLCISFVTYAELLKGAELSTRKQVVLGRLQRLTRQMPELYPKGSEICRHYGLRARVQILVLRIAFVEMIEDVAQQPQHRLLGPAIVPLVEVDVVDGVREDAVDILFVR